MTAEPGTEEPEPARLVHPTPAVRDSYLAGEGADCAERGEDTAWLDAAAEDFAAFATEAGRTKERWGVPSTAFWYVSGDTYLGSLAVRHALTPALEQIGGHIGFHIVGARQRQGHATRMLAAGLDRARQIGLTRALLTCLPDNIGSATVIRSNGGVPAEPDSTGELRFWIDIPQVTLRPLTRDDAAAHCAGEDDETVRWLTGAYGTVEGTADYFDQLAANAAAGTGKRGYGIWLDDRLAGYVDFDPDSEGALEPGDVNLAYAVHPWARGRGVAVDGVRQLCDLLREQGIGTRAVIRVQPENTASAGVARAAGFQHAGDFTSTTDTHADGTPVRMSRYVLPLRAAGS